MSILKNVSYSFGAQIVNAAFSFVISIYLSRLLGPEGRGTNAIFQNALGFAALFFGLSINSTIIYFVNSGKIDMKKLFSSLLLFCLVSTAAVAAFLFGLKRLDLLTLVLPESYHSINYILLFSLLHFNTLLNSIFLAFLTAYKRFKTQSLLLLIPTILSLLAYVSAYHVWMRDDREHAFDLVLAVTTITGSLNLLLTAVFYIKEIKVFPGKELMNWADVRLMLMFSLMAYVGNVLQFLSYRLDFWFVDAYCGKAQLGIYSLATQLSQLLWLMPTAVSGVLYSYASSATGEEAGRYAAKLTNNALYGSLLMALAMLAIFYFTLPFIYGNEFAPAVPIMAILMFGIVPFVIPTILSSYFAAKGYFNVNFYCSCLGFLVSIVLYSTFIPLWGTFGGALSSVFSYLINVTVAIIIFKKISEIDYALLLKPGWNDLMNLKKYIYARTSLSGN